MTNHDTKQDFIELHTFWKQNPSNEQHTESKTPSAESEATSPQSSSTPQILVHRKENIIESIEFRCTCGKSAIVHLEYDGE